MKTVIIYMSHHGTTQRIARYLRQRLGANNTLLVNLEREKPPVSFDDFDTILIGGSIHSGLIQRGIRKFCEQHQDDFPDKRIGLFFCFMDKEHAVEEFENSFPESLRNISVANGFFGGEFLIEKMDFFEKLIIRKIMGVKETVHSIDRKAIEDFITTIKDGDLFLTSRNDMKI